MRLGPIIAVLLLLEVISSASALSPAATPRHGVFEAELSSDRKYASPSADVELSVEFTSPSGDRTKVDAFWDGDDLWRFRFSPTRTGKWTWRSKCSDRSNSGLHDRIGDFICNSYRGSNKLQSRGPLELSENRRHLVYSNGNPFLWLADTAWNGVLKATDADWDKYLKERKAQGFTAVQFVSTPWRAFDRDDRGDTAFTGKDNIRINPAFFKRLDAKVAAINARGLVASPVILWAVGGSDPGQALSEKDAIRLSRYIVARWGALNVVWMLGGDGNYGGDRAERWRRIGRAVFGDKPNRPVTMHPGGQHWVGDEFRREPWFSFIGYQSGHGDSTGAVRWLVQGPPAVEWRKTPVLPVINLEPNYEAHLAYDSRTPFDALAVRKALYRSLLVSPTAGVTYGHHGIWSWSGKAEVPVAHGGSGVAPPWHEALKAEGATSVKRLSDFFRSIKWWTLVPDPMLVADRPDDPHRFIASARSDDGRLAVIYMPSGDKVTLNTTNLKRPRDARWYQPSTGRYTKADKITTDSHTCTPPGAGDWILLIK